MQHLTALGIKYLMIAIVLGITLGLIGGAGFTQVLVASLILTAVAYAVGDLIILPATQNWVAVAADAAIAWAVLRFSLPEAATGWALLLSVLAVASGEYFFHMYMNQEVLRENRQKNR